LPDTGQNPFLSIMFAVSLAVGFFMLYFFENGSKTHLTPTKMSLMIAIGIGLQNLTEGLVFGSSAAKTLGLFSGIALVILVGFILQNITEGFPIAAPMVGKKDKRGWMIPALFLVGGIPTILGGTIGFFFSSSLFNILFDGLAVGAILYVIIPMIRHQVRDVDNMKQKLVYVGIFIGFIVGFLVNLI
jgi:zinc transporter, ZIP family